MSTGRRLVKRTGRPPAAINERGEPEATSKWDQLGFRVRPRTKATLDGLCALDRRPLWQIFETLLLTHVANLPADDRKLIDLVAKRRLKVPTPSQKRR
jgi:hypothetical protein